jgi:hypothetical protein
MKGTGVEKKRDAKAKGKRSGNSSINAEINIWIFLAGQYKKR